MPIDPVLASTIDWGQTTGGNLLTDWLNWRRQQRMNETNRNWMEEQALNERMWNKHMWELNNIYNTPKMQVERLRAAGLNPALMYGNTANTGVSSSPAQGYDRPNIEGKSYNFRGASGSGIFERYQTMRNIQAQTDNVSADTLIKKQRAINEATANELQVLDKYQKTFDLMKDKKMFPHQLDALIQGINETTERIKKIREETGYITVMTDHEGTKKMLTEKQIAQIEANIKLINAQSGKTYHDMRYARKLADLFEMWGITDKDHWIARSIINGLTNDEAKRYLEERFGVPREKEPSYKTRRHSKGAKAKRSNKSYYNWNIK